MTMERNKTLSLLAMSIFAVVVLVGFASAAFQITPDTLSKTVKSGTTSVSFDISVDNDGAGGNYTLTWNGSTSEGTLVFPTLTTSTDGLNESTSFSITSIPSDFVGTITGDLIAQSSLVDRVVPFTIKVTEDLPQEISDCKALGMPSSATDVRIKKIDLQNNGIEISSTTGTSVTFGEDESWFPFENIEATIEVKNYGEYDADNVEVSWGVWDTDTNEWVIEPDSEKDFKLDHGDTDSVTVNFRIDDDVDMNLEDLRDGSHYKFYAYLSDGVVDDSDSPDDGADFCAYDSQDTEMVIEGNFVTLTNVDIPQTLQCGESVEVTADVWNIGDRDQDSVTLSVEGRESALNFAKDFSVGDLNSFDNQEVRFTFTVPKNIDEKYYALKFQVLDEDDDVYQTDFNDDDSEVTIPFQVSGNCGSSSAEETLIAASLVSGGQAGKDLVVKATITNTGSELKTYSITATGFNDWADSSSVDQNTLVLNPDESKDVTFTFPVNKDASGDQMFYIEAVSGNVVIRQPVSVSIEAGSAFGFTGNSIFGDNRAIWLLGLLNVILVIVIIIVAVRVARR